MQNMCKCGWFQGEQTGNTTTLMELPFTLVKDTDIKQLII